MMPPALLRSPATSFCLPAASAAAAGVQIFATSDRRRSLSLPLFVRTRVGAVLCPGSRLEFSASMPVDLDYDLR